MSQKRKLPEGMYQRGRHYYCDFYAGGQRIRKKLATDFEVARRILVEVRARAEKADFGLIDNDYPLDRLKGEYLEHCRQVLRPKTVVRNAATLTFMLGKLAARRVSQVTAADLLNYRRDRLASGRVVASTVNVEVDTFAAMLNWGVRYRIIASNPLRALKHLPHPHRKRGRPFTTEEVRRFLDASRPPYRDIWYAYLVTGMRKNELASVTWDDIDWESREIIVRDAVAKNHTQRRIPIDDGLWEIIKRLEAGRMARQPGKGNGALRTRQIRARFTRDHVFVTGQNTPLEGAGMLIRVFRQTCRRAGIVTHNYDAHGHEIDHVDIHSFRRTFATDLIVSGADPKSVQELLGHKTLDMTMRIYAQIHGRTKRQAVGKLSYGQGAQQPEGILDLRAVPRPSGHDSVTSDPTTQIETA